MKKRLIALCLLIIALFLIGCGGNDEVADETIDAETGCSLEENFVCGEDGLTYVNSCYSSLRNVAVQYLGTCEYEICSFYGQDHYFLNNLIYYEDDKSRPYIALEYGMFYQNDNGGWTYRKDINTEVTYYANRMAEYETGVTERGDTVVCSVTTEAPSGLKEFLKTHGHILELNLDETA
jgi:hypothetical protein